MKSYTLLCPNCYYVPETNKRICVNTNAYLLGSTIPNSRINCKCITCCGEKNDD